MSSSWNYHYHVPVPYTGSVQQLDVEAGPALFTWNSAELPVVILFNRLNSPDRAVNLRFLPHFLSNLFNY